MAEQRNTDRKSAFRKIEAWGLVIKASDFGVVGHHL